MYYLTFHIVFVEPVLMGEYLYSHFRGVYIYNILRYLDSTSINIEQMTWSVDMSKIPQKTIIVQINLLDPYTLENHWAGL